MLFIKKDRNLIFLAADNFWLSFTQNFSVYCRQMRKCFINFSHLTRGSANRQWEYSKFYQIEFVIFELKINFRIYFERKHVAVKGLTVRDDYAAQARDEHVTKLDDVLYIIIALVKVKTSRYLSKTNEVWNKARGWKEKYTIPTFLLIS